ncbi:efflux RND transporter permease subunit [Sphingomonas azotifigens]|uniref:efflux RND transporter permease subunit n=1 Tax=Sphingomonas azotifigens TaxID=330920 RepID=UPI0009FD4387|nr:efflux RND transporter permease subunit [Sphingomonas azotifigens]
MWLIRSALRRPITLMVLVLALVLGSGLAISRARVDILPDLDAPVIYVAQPYGGMSPQQMQGFISYYYEYHFLYINGIESVEAKSVQGASLLRLTFQSGTDMSQALAETISYVNRARAFMPPGAVSPFVVRFDAGTLPVGYLVFSSATKTLGEIQDVALNRVRPAFATLPGVSSPPPFGGNQRSIVVNVDPAKLHGLGLSTEDVLQGLVSGNSIQPAGSANVGTKQVLVTTDATVKSIDTLLDIPIRPNGAESTYLRDVATVSDTTDIPAGYALVDGKRTVYIPVTKRANASTLTVVNEVRKSLPVFQDLLPDDVSVTYALDQSKYVTRALASVVIEGLLGALLVGLTLFLFLRDWRSSIIVVIVIPLALLSAVLLLWLAGQTINIMTLGGLALAIGVLVDDGTVLLENIHVHMARGTGIARAVVDASREVAIPRLLAMTCILAVFLPSFAMTGPARALFVPLSLAVAFAIGSAYVLFSTLVPVLSNWLLRSHQASELGVEGDERRFGRFRSRFLGWQQRSAERPGRLLWLYAFGAPLLLVAGTLLTHSEIFPSAASTQIRLRVKAPEGTRIAVTEQLAQQVLAKVQQAAGPGKVATTLGYVGTQGSSYPINLVFLWTGGPNEAVLNIDLAGGLTARTLTAKLRETLPQAFPGVSFSFEPGDLISQILNYGTASTVDIAVKGPQYGDVAQYAGRLKAQLAGATQVADLQYGQALHYPNVDVQIDRVLAGQLGTTADKVAKAVVSGTASTRFVTPNFWRDPKSGVSYQVQVQVPQPKMTSVGDIANIPVATNNGSDLALSQVARLNEQTVPGELDRKNGQWLISLTGNVAGNDLSSAGTAIDHAIAAAGEKPKGVSVEVRGQVTVLRQIFGNLAVGLAASLLVMLLLLVANFQSVRLALVTLTSVPAALLGAIAFLLLTSTSLNLESFMGMIMVVGVALANSILLVSFAERNRRSGSGALKSALEAAEQRLRPIVMTTIAMVAGMIPMALALSDGSEATAPLGRAVIGGLLASTAATLFILPLVFGLVQRNAPISSVSLDPDDPGGSNVPSEEVVI